ncbi:acyl-CoA dehydrogenase family protein [Bradyrhizobium sp. BRP22]|uniref:acyl-CoA dehydrogenase family protein n=1 Tax=Bradyrhizobium sp. BRP22 TaxID=2793821 RepID=UPI001CD50934|nr:acyl-CoA dehydrogenase family protein [Bradyrhizobium sp. BRP22]MCA1458572.1 acyl-CoA dehydrogenase family protein [Bradyrhizobium sp. BRP22]
MLHQDQFRDLRSLTTPDGNNAMLAGIRKLAPDITARAAEIEAARCVPADLIDHLKSVGIFRMCVPRSHGGLELALPAGLEVIRTLARLDGSIGWTAMTGSGGSIFATWEARETYDRIYRDGPDVAVCGSAQPAGTAEPAAGGFRVSGRWPFASGCRHAEWMAGFCIMTDDHGKPVAGPHGQPLVRGFALPAQNWEVEDTWHAAGLRGTGSHHIVLRDVLVPAANFFDVEGGTPCVPGPLYPAVRHLLPMFHSALAVGIAEGAVDELLTLAHTGRQQFRATTPMRDSETFQYELGRISADLSAAQAFCETQTARLWHHALAGTLNDEGLLVEGTQASTWIATTCVRVVDACFALAGSSAVYETSPLPRRLRDIHVAAQHATAQQRQYVAGGKLLLARSAQDAGHA